MDKGYKRRISWLAVGIVIMLINPIFIILGITIILLVAIDYLLFKPRKKEEKEEYEIPIEEENNVDKIRANIEKVKIKNEEEKEIRKNVDLRQFKGRNDVTKEELAKYLWYHQIWEGRREKEIICEEIAKVSNLTNEDIRWVINEHYNHKGNDGISGSGHWIKNEEAKREIEYRRKKVREFDEEIEKISKEKANKKEEYEYIFYYEDWLKKKGYI